MILGRYFFNGGDIVLEAEDGLDMQVAEGNGNLTVTAKRMISTARMQLEGKNPPIPSGYKYKKGRWSNGFTIQRQSDKSQFTWVPVGWLEFNGTLDGRHYNERFGRRNFRYNEFSAEEYSEPMCRVLEEQIQSIVKYGGFYISSFLISKGEDGKLHSLKNKDPLTNVSIEEAKILAQTIENTAEVTSHLQFGAEFDTVLEWLLKCGTRSVEDIIMDSTGWGSEKICKTGRSRVFCSNNIWDLSGNADELTQETYKRCYGVVRGGNSWFSGSGKPVSYRYFQDPKKKIESAGMRVCLTIK